MTLTKIHKHLKTCKKIFKKSWFLSLSKISGFCEVLIFDVSRFTPASDASEEGNEPGARLPLDVIPPLAAMQWKHSWNFVSYSVCPWPRGVWPLEQVPQPEASQRRLPGFIHGSRPVDWTLGHGSLMGAVGHGRRAPRWRCPPDTLVTLPHSIIVLPTRQGQSLWACWSVLVRGGSLGTSQRAEDSPRRAHVPVVGEEEVSGSGARGAGSSWSVRARGGAWHSVPVEAAPAVLVVKHLPSNLHASSQLPVCLPALSTSSFSLCSLACFFSGVSCLVQGEALVFPGWGLWPEGDPTIGDSMFLLHLANPSGTVDRKLCKADSRLDSGFRSGAGHDTVERRLAEILMLSFRLRFCSASSRCSVLLQVHRDNIYVDSVQFTDTRHQ